MSEHPSISHMVHIQHSIYDEDCAECNPYLRDGGVR